MKYVYGTFSALGLLGGLVLFPFGIDKALLAFIFGAVCAVAAEISELAEKVVAQTSTKQKAE